MVNHGNIVTYRILTGGRDMKKRIGSARIRFTLPILALVVGVMGLFAGCNKGGVKETAFFRYQILNNGRLEIIGLTEQGAQEKVLTVPSEIEGIPVYRCAKSTFLGNPGNWESDALEKVFFPENISVVGGIFSGCYKLTTVCIVKFSLEDKAGNMSISHNCGGERIKCYVRSSVYKNGFGPSNSLSPANVSYQYNYEDAENHGVYWIDNVPYGETIDYIPVDPVREGFVFGGWYKEAACVNKWDYDSDRLPEEEIIEEEEPAEDGETVEEEKKAFFLETKLYAKWTG
jgi:hypothetical protein